MGKELAEILKVDHVGPLSKVVGQLGKIPYLHPQHIAQAMRREARSGNGRYYEKNNAWWKPKKRRVEWYDNVLYVTKEEDILLAWMRHHGGDPYRLFILLGDESLEPFFAKLYKWEYVPTSSVWQGLESKEVIAYLEW
jgi:hypothetical protein